ncbi:MAG: MSCRAMM family adhesin SdrC [Myxococcales bacterium]|nr:MSCRAMM family adhesin SdrC [Myxococcales bacterium]
MFTERSLRLRALRAALAVTVGTVALTGCSSESGSLPETDVDSATDSATDVTVDTVSVDSDDDVAVQQDSASDEAAVPDDAVTLPDAEGDSTSESDTPDADLSGLDSSTVDDVLVADTADVAAEDVSTADLVDDPLSDAFDDVSTDVMVGLDVDGDTGVPVTCRAERDEQCPMECTRDNDVDCCDQYNAGFGGGLCFFDPSFGCGCAVEGPFAPPSLPARRPILTAV